MLVDVQWENHAKSLRLEEQTLQRIRERIQTKVMTGTEGTWIDWQCLLDAAVLLARCRYTLQYTYPYAYYMDPGPRKELVILPLSFFNKQSLIISNGRVTRHCPKNVASEGNLIVGFLAVFDCAAWHAMCSQVDKLNCVLRACILDCIS